MNCYCTATPLPPCGWCENLFECNLCGKVKNKDDDGGVEIDQLIACGSCIEEMSERKNHLIIGVCICPIIELMITGCKCGGK